MAGAPVGSRPQALTFGAVGWWGTGVAGGALMGLGHCLFAYQYTGFSILEACLALPALALQSISPGGPFPAAKQILASLSLLVPHVCPLPISEDPAQIQPHT